MQRASMMTATLPLERPLYGWSSLGSSLTAFSSLWFSTSDALYGEMLERAVWAFVGVTLSGIVDVDVAPGPASAAGLSDTPLFIVCDRLPVYEADTRRIEGAK